MHTSRRFRSLWTIPALAVLLLAPWPAAAAPSHPFDAFTNWLADLWAEAGLSWDPDGLTSGGEPVSMPMAGLSWDPNGGASGVGGGTPPAGTDSADVGLILDPDGRPQ